MTSSAGGTAGVELSVIVPFRDSAPHLGRQLGALAAQDFAGTWEVIAVDNGSRDGSRHIAEGFLGRMNLHIVQAPVKFGAGHARNVGAGYASGRKLIFVDADDEVAPGYVSAMAVALDRHDFVTSAFDHRSLNPDWVQRAHGPLWRDPDDPLPALFGLLPFAGGSVGVASAIFHAVGGYFDDFPRAQDIAFSWEVQLAGTELHYVPDAVYRVRYRGSLRELFRQALAWGSSIPLLYRRYRTAGMQRRPLLHTARLWIGLLLHLTKARTRADLAPLIVQAGLLLGRVKGSVRYRVLFL
jgi:glycosyltransferase involved in cell wall biosynthesis